MSSLADRNGPFVTELPGLDLDRFRRYYERQRPGDLRGPLRGRLIAGGKSNLTYEVTDGHSWWIVRRPPLGHVLATAHDMRREFRVMTALRDTAVPVPRTYALCEDPEVSGAPFFVMQRVIGTPYRDASQLMPLGAARTRVISTRMIDTLLALHEVDPAAVQLTDFGRPDGFLKRQVRRWRQQFDASRSRDLPDAEELHRRLVERTPQPQPPAVVHGDYRLDNLLISEDHVAAVIDWEMATIGDPLTDIALLMTYRRMAEFGSASAVADAGTAPGFLTDVEMLQHYARFSSRDVNEIGFYLGLAAFKLAVVLEGIHFRFLQGQTVGAGFENIGDIVEPLISVGLSSIKENA
ncbi:Predicted kinase, aminoglycoside phosphotransferase (APT) family [Micromonospora pallida]|uniref:Predicted kinase, aminoglycoside phosphotransferase (APT) family n=1 Tax=Micromonospora pallida TaxID=145854 RepID=A0A1C6RSK2_9ACTN|nr:phosphotransferase family protein [Micromonospora pallida]SCL20117.1 Predicted kinase, aminoglycoside phosphotransferase (APT) family [Micromonospora pallida]